MRRVVFFMLALAACRRESPTEPLRETEAVTSEIPPAIRITPDPVVVGVGQEVSVTARLTQDLFTYPTSVPLQTNNCSNATLVTRSFPANEKTATVIIRGSSPGGCDIYYNLISFGARGHVGVAGHVVVTEQPPGTPRPPVPEKEITMVPNPVLLRPGEEARVRVTLAMDAGSDVTLGADPHNVVQVTGKIARGTRSATITVRGVAPGKANVMAGTRIAGRAIVDAPPPPRRRASRS